MAHTPAVSDVERAYSLAGLKSMTEREGKDQVKPGDVADSSKWEDRKHALTTG